MVCYSSFSLEREVHGVLLLDKPSGISSNNVLQKVKRIYSANRAGYVGTLDPMATGMLPICFGEATKFSQYLSNSDKRYRVIAKLGQKTDTSDADGRVIKERPILFKKNQLETILEKFRGKVLQIPSMFSAIKFRGKKLYEYARKGIKVSRKPRLITIYQLLLVHHGEMELELEVHCSKGTYIRTIVDDLGEDLGCGAHVIYLRRLSINNFPTENMVTLEKLQEMKRKSQVEGALDFKMLQSFLVPIRKLFSNFPVINLPLTLSTHFKKGNPVYLKNPKINGLFSVTEGEERKFIGIGEFNDTGCIIPRRLITKNLV